MNFEEILLVAQAERKLAAAHLDLDLKIFDELLHTEYVVLQPNGTIETKNQVLDSVAI